MENATALEQGQDPLFIAESWMKDGRDVAIATVVETWGSAPRPVGSHLVIDREGNFQGSVSGGCVEGAVVTEALDVLESGKPRMLGQEVGVLSHAIAGALDLDYHSVVKKAVEQRCGHHGIAKDITPFGEAAVGCQDHGTLFVSGVDELEEQVGRVGFQRQVTELVDDQQFRLRQRQQFLVQAPLAARRAPWPGRQPASSPW